MTIDAGAGTREQADPARRPRVHPDSELTEQQAETLYRMLVDTRRSALERQERLSDDRFTTEQVSESEEAAALDTSQSTSIDLAENERTLLLQIERALGKMGDGTYGVSEESGEPIGFDRLRIVPWATLTTAEQEMAEHEARQRGR